MAKSYAQKSLLLTAMPTTLMVHAKSVKVVTSIQSTKKAAMLELTSALFILGQDHALLAPLHTL
jgi:hypothetical protein